jgi:hypothetical protein
MANTYLYRQVSSSDTNKNKVTISLWFKKCTTGVEETLISGWMSDNNRWKMRFKSDDTLDAEFGYGGTYYNLRTNRLFRDTSGWYHCVLAYDTTQGTASERAKMYINGIQETSFLEEVYPPQNYGIYLVENTAQVGIGRGYYGGSYQSGTNWSGLMSHVYVTDGYTYTASTFGSTDSTTGEWQINTSPSVTYGNNGFFILKNGNTITDQSGEGNNFTLGGGTLTKTEDNPSNVFNVWNVLDVVAGTNAPLENGNTTYLKTATGSTTSGSRMGTIGASSGKFYWEFKNKSNIDFITGIIRSNHVPSTGLQGWLANDAGAYGFYRTGTITVGGAVSSGTGMITVLSGNIVGVAVDLDNGKFYSHVNGTYMNSGDPTSGATGTGSLFNISLTNTYMPWVCNQDYNQPNDIEYNFGNGYFGTTAVTSAGTAGSTPGTFEYDVPSGYEPLTTKGLNA